MHLKTPIYIYKRPLSPETVNVLEGLGDWLFGGNTALVRIPNLEPTGPGRGHTVHNVAHGTVGIGRQTSGIHTSGHITLLANGVHLGVRQSART